MSAAVIAREEKWQGTLTAIGSVTAVQGVTVTPEIAGIVREIAFESGAVVSKGDLLVRLDTSLEEAQLRALEAQDELARLNAARERSLRAQNMVSNRNWTTPRRPEAEPGQMRMPSGRHPQEDHPRAIRREAWASA